MAKTKKSYFPGSDSLTWKTDLTYKTTETFYVDSVAGADETKRKLDAYATVGVTVGKTHPDLTLAAKGCRCVSISVALITTTQASVTLTYDTPDEPLVDGSWIFETNSEPVRITTAHDINGKLIVIKYIPPHISEASEVSFLSKTGNKREFERGMTTNGYDNIIHLRCRAQYSFKEGAKKRVLTWPYKYVNWVNDEITLPAGSGLQKTPAGVWMCKSMNIATRNNSATYLVDGEFVYNKKGWEEMVVFTYKDGTIPGNSWQPAGMRLDSTTGEILAWPTVRTATHFPYGMIRPQTVEGLKDFGADPLGINLSGFIQ